MRSADTHATESLFFALRPPADVARAACAVAESPLAERPEARRVAWERLHVTLHYLGAYAELPAAVLARAQRAGGDVRAAPFVLAFDRLASFGGQRRQFPGILLGDSAGTAGAVALHHALGVALQEGQGPAPLQGDVPFMPHMTLFYDHDRWPEQPLPAPLAWQVDALWLLRSVRGERRYREEGCWPLHA